MDLLGITIHDPDVAFTDLGLAVLGGYFGARLGATLGGALMAFLASAAFWGAVYHGLFPGGTAVRAGLLLWFAVLASIVLAAATLVTLSLRVLAPGLPRAIRWSLVGVYTAAFGTVVFLIDHSFTSVVRFYGPALALFLLVAAVRAVRTRDAGWTLMAAGLACSVIAALVQQLRVVLHPIYFDHNALYHVVQGGALVLIYFGFRRAPGLRVAAGGMGTVQ